MNTSKTTNSKISEIRDEHQDDLTTTGNSNLNNSAEGLLPNDLTSDLDFNRNVAPFNRKLSAPNPLILQLTLNQNNAENRLRCSYYYKLVCNKLANF